MAVGTAGPNSARTRRDSSSPLPRCRCQWSTRRPYVTAHEDGALWRQLMSVGEQRRMHWPASYATAHGRQIWAAANWGADVQRQALSAHPAGG